MAKTYSVVPDKAAGAVFTEAMWDDSIKTNINNLRVPASFGAQGGGDAITAGALASLTWTSEEWDTDAMGTGYPIGDFVIKTSGLWLFQAYAEWGITNGGYMILNNDGIGDFAMGGVYATRGGVSGVCSCLANDVISVNILLASTSTSITSSYVRAVWLCQTS